MADLGAAGRDACHRICVGGRAGLCGEHPGQRGHIQRVAFRTGMHEPRQFRVHGHPGCPQDAGHGRLAQRRQPQHLHAGQPGQVAQRGPPGIAGGVAAGGQHEQPRFRQLGRELPEQEQRRMVRPLQVLKDNEQVGGARCARESIGRRGRRAEPGRGQVVRAGAVRTTLPVRRSCSSTPPTAFSIRRHGHNGGAPRSSTARPHSTRCPSRRALSASSSASRVLPMPGGPVSTTSRPPPASASASHPRSAASSCSRPARLPGPGTASATRPSSRARRAAVHAAAGQVRWQAAY